ncbi:MAG: hypothetical protein KA764_12330 [Anaerolineales bacterium]|nr:hypothetical protein [Anaerolineales bacterium]
MIAKTGLARGSQLRNELANLWGIEPGDPAIRETVQAAITADYLRVHVLHAEWAGAHRKLVELTSAGQDRAAQLGCPCAPSELAESNRRGLDLETLNLVLAGADILRASGYTEVCVFPPAVALPAGVTYAPMLSARDQTGATIYVECARSSSLMPRSTRWQVAAQAGGGALYLIAPTPAILVRLTTEINVARLQSDFRVMALNVNEHLKGRRGSNDSIWFYQRHS